MTSQPCRPICRPTHHNVDIYPSYIASSTATRSYENVCAVEARLKWPYRSNSTVFQCLVGIPPDRPG
eukprot:scaffold8741_cov142-Skeletonema_menzelii.AAC.7